MTKQEEIKLEVGNVYLIETYEVLFETYVEKITEIAYKFRIERIDGSWFIEWVNKDVFKSKYILHEFLYTLPQSPLLEKQKQNILTECPVCGGAGEIPDDKNTTGKRPCPHCWGSIDLLQYHL